MLVSLAAASVDKYKWFQYLGKRTISFENHHRKYDLDLAPKMKYGIRTYAGKLKLAVLADPSVVFTLSEAEVKKIVKLSAGYSGRVKGVDLEAGVGGKDVKGRKERVHNPDSGLPAKYYPSIPMPPSKQDIARLYNYFNKLHFDNECPSKVIFQLSEASKFSGQAQLRIKKGVYEFTLKLSKHALTDLKRICKIVLHEMIHLLHYKRYYVDGNALYAQAGHGTLFLEEMHRLNKFGYDIDTKEYDITEAELVNPEYVLHLEINGDQHLVFHSSKDFEKEIPNLLEELRFKLTNYTFVQYKYGPTTSSYAFSGAKLTRNHSISKNKRLRIFPNKYLKSLEEKMTVRQEKDLTPVRGDIRPEIYAAIESAMMIIDQNLNRFMHAVLSFAYISKHNDGNAMLQALDIARDQLTQAEYQEAERKWASIEDRHLLKSEHFKMLRKQILLKRLEGKDAIEWLSRGFDKNAYEGRIDYQRYAKLCVEYFGDILAMTDRNIEKYLIEALHRRWK